MKCPFAKHMGCHITKPRSPRKYTKLKAFLANSRHSTITSANNQQLELGFIKRASTQLLH
jgi:hypothetical protein